MVELSKILIFLTSPRGVCNCIFYLQVTRLCDLSNDGNAVTSVSWSERGGLVAVGTQKGYISVWDVAVNKEVPPTYIINNDPDIVLPLL